MKQLLPAWKADRLIKAWPALLAGGASMNLLANLLYRAGSVSDIALGMLFGVGIGLQILATAGAWMHRKHS